MLNMREVYLMSPKKEKTGPFPYYRAMEIIRSTRFSGYTVRASDGRTLDAWLNGRLNSRSFYDIPGEKGWASREEQDKL